MFNIINKFNTIEREIDINVEDVNVEDVNIGDENVGDENVGDENVGDENENTQTSNELLNENDEDENNIERKYIISIDGTPFYFHNDLNITRRYMWSIGNNFIAPNNDVDNEYYITTNNINHIKIMKTYDFFFFKYSFVENELKIDYVVPCKI
jgi:hypothetical protein